MKKFLMMLISTLLVVSVVGCGSSSSDSDDNKTKVAQEADDGVAANGEEVEAGTAAEGAEEVASTPGPFTDGKFGAISLSGKSYEDIQAELDGAALIDIRTAWERDYYGYPSGFVNNAVYQNRDYSIVNGKPKYNTKPHNDNFVNDVKAIVKNDLNKKIVIICDSSSRTGKHYDGNGEISSNATAAKELSNAGFTNVYHIKGGFRGDEDGNYENGWEDLFPNKIVKK